MMRKNRIALYCQEDHPKFHESKLIANDLDISLIISNEVLENKYDYILFWEFNLNNYYLSIRSYTDKLSKSLNVDYVNNIIAGKKCYKFSYNDVLPKAMGLSKLKDKKINILDATAGFTLDSYALLELNKNIHITLLENSKVLFFLLKDGLERLSLGSESSIDISKRVTLLNINFIDYIQSQTAESNFDIIYLDPMFEKDKASAKPKQNMQLLQDICVNPNTVKELLEAALNYKNKTKIVLKRNIKQPKLLEKNINYSVSSKQIRYDVYINQ